MKRILFFAMIAMVSLIANADDNLKSQFANPETDCRTKLWWFHGETITTEEGIRHDLQAFKDKGIGGVVFYDQVHGKAEDAFPSMSAPWWKMLKYAAKTARELGLSFEVAAGNGYVTGGPWIMPELAMKKTVFVDTIIYVESPASVTLPLPDKDFHDIASLVFKDSEGLKAITTDIQPIKLMPGDTAIVFDLGKEETIRGISYDITPRGKGSTGSMNIPGSPAERYFAAKYVEYPPVGNLEISSDMTDWTDCCTLLPVENTIGFKSKRRTISFPEKSGRYIRLRLHDEKIADESYKPVTLSDFTLYRRDIIDNKEVKAGLRTEVTYPAEEGGDTGAIKSDDIINITDSICSDGSLSVTLPEGIWHIIRAGYTHTGAKTKHGRRNLLGLEADVMSAEAANIHYDNYFKAILDTLSTIGCPPTGMSMDSHEAGCQNWTKDFEKIFNKSRGYDLTPYLAAMAGYIVDSREKSEIVLHDFRRTVAETITSEYYGTLARRSHEDGVTFTSQSMLNILADNIANRSNADYPQGEFWAYQKDGNYDCLDAASAAHIYGRNIASGEAFTDTPYGESWTDLLRLANLAYCRGINEFAVCASSYQPWNDRKYDDSSSAHPYIYHRHNPDWESSGSFWDYQGRCATMLREGVPVVDLAIYIGEEPPLKTFAFKLPEIPDGFKFDVFTLDALNDRMQAGESGDITVDGGMRYKAIIVQDRTYISPEANRRLEDLQRDGARVIWCNRGESVSDAITKYGIKKDLDADAKLQFFHRRSADKDIYFIYNHSDKKVDDTVSLRTPFSKFEIWNPNTGGIEPVTSDGNHMNLTLDAGQALFIVCSD